MQGHGELEEDEPRQVAPVRRGGAEVRHHAVDDELPDPQHHDRRESGQDAGRHDPGAVGRLRVPHHLQEARHVPERLEALAHGRQRLAPPGPGLVEELHEGNVRRRGGWFDGGGRSGGRRCLSPEPGRSP